MQHLLFQWMQANSQKPKRRPFRSHLDRRLRGTAVKLQCRQSKPKDRQRVADTTVSAAARTLLTEAFLRLLLTSVRQTIAAECIERCALQTTVTRRTRAGGAARAGCRAS